MEKKTASKKVSTGDKTILQEAQELIYGDRHQAYGSVKENFRNTAKGWEVILSQRNQDFVQITEEDVSLMIIWLKVCRQCNKPSRDNIIDIAGYAGCIEKIGLNK